LASRLPIRLQKVRNQAKKYPDGFIQKYLRIESKMGPEVQMRLTSAQRKIAHIIKEAHKSGKPVRESFVKWRRATCSAYMTARGYTHAWANDNARIGIIAHLEDRAKELLDNYKKFDQRLEVWHPELLLPKSRDFVSGLKFQHNSSILIASAENPIKIRGDGLHRVHNSEWAHFYALFDRVMEEICPVVPPEPGSEIINETTGTLRGSAPHEHWEASKAGQNEFTPHFLCWLEDEDSKIPVTSQHEYHELLAKMRDLEPRLVEKNKHYKLTPEQILQSWNFYFYQSKCDFDYFCREFPYREEEAWSAGGASYFGAYEIGKAKPEHPMAMFIFDEHNLNTVFPSFDELRKVDKLDHYGVMPSLKIWTPPVKGSMYILGSDGGQGTAYGDYSTGYIVDAHTRECMANYHGRLRPDEAGHIQVALARIYNNAICAPETNPAGGGAEAMNVMQRLGYFNFYNWRVRDAKEGLRMTNKIGWWTHPRSRAQMMQTLRQDFLDSVNGRIKDTGMFKDEALLDEMRTFSSNPRSGIPEANSGCADDRVIAKAICHQVAADEVYCTSKDLIFAQSRLESSHKPIDQATLVKRRLRPDQVMAQFTGKNGGFANNKFEIQL
jgi:hypothetical protein